MLYWQISLTAVGSVRGCCFGDYLAVCCVLDVFVSVYLPFVTVLGYVM